MNLNKGLYVEVKDASITHDGDYLVGEYNVFIATNGNTTNRTFHFPDSYGYFISRDDSEFHSKVESIQQEMKNSLVELFEFTSIEAGTLQVTLVL